MSASGATKIERTSSMGEVEMMVLADYKNVPIGFELLRKDVFLPFEGMFELPWTEDEGDFLSFGLWDVSVRKREPDQWDDEIRYINQMQKALGDLEEDTRFLRIQISCFERCWYNFSENINIILQGISQGRPEAEHVSCEPPWSNICMLLRRRMGVVSHPEIWDRYCEASTGYDPNRSPRQRLARAYIGILNWWSARGDLTCLRSEMPEYGELAEKIYSWLGEPTKLKRLYVERIKMRLTGQAYPQTAQSMSKYIGKEAEEMGKVIDRCVEAETGVKREDDPILSRIGMQDLCHHAFFRRTDIQIASVGANEWRALPETGEGRRHIEKNITNYYHALNSWLGHKPLSQAKDEWPEGAETTEKVYALLGGDSPTKRWLVASLWKTIKENHRNKGRGELDSHPEKFEPSWIKLET